MQRISTPSLQRQPLREQLSRLERLRERSPEFRSRARVIEAGRLVVYFVFLFFFIMPLIDHLRIFWAICLVTAGFAVIDWAFRRLLLLPAADKEIQRLAEHDATSNGG